MILFSADELLDKLSPFHFIVDREMRFVRIGPALKRLRPAMNLGERLDTQFRITVSSVAATFQEASARSDATLALDSTDGALRLRGKFWPRGGGGLFLCAPLNAGNDDLAGL